MLYNLSWKLQGMALKVFTEFQTYIQRFQNLILRGVGAYRTTRQQPTRGQSSCRLDNSRTSQLADSEFLKFMELLYFISTLNLTLTIIVTH